MAEREVKYVEYVKSRFPQINISNIKFNFSDGKYSNIVIINDQFIFKFSRYDWTVGYLANEGKIINFIRDSVDMPLPNIEYLGPGIAKYNLIEGTPLFRNKILLLEDREQDFIAEQIGTFLKQLHSIPLKRVKNNKINEISANLTGEGFLSEYDSIQRKVYPYCSGYEKESIKQIFAPLLEDTDFLKFTPALIHADLTAHHFIYDSSYKRINAAIGFGSAGIGDPAYDVSAVLDSLGEAFLKRVEKYYGDMEELVDRARFYASFRHLDWAQKLADMITTRDFSEFQFDIPFGDRMPIGSKW
jgi:aminoglycoside 2''-phosphotransferase